MSVVLRFSSFCDFPRLRLDPSGTRRSFSNKRCPSGPKIYLPGSMPFVFSLFAPRPSFPGKWQHFPFFPSSPRSFSPLGTRLFFPKTPLPANGSAPFLFSRIPPFLFFDAGSLPFAMSQVISPATPYLHFSRQLLVRRPVTPTTFSPSPSSALFFFFFFASCDRPFYNPSLGFAPLSEGPLSFTSRQRKQKEPFLSAFFP